VLNTTWTESDVADFDSESECKGIQNIKIKVKSQREREREREKTDTKQFILVPLTTQE